MGPEYVALARWIVALFFAFGAGLLVGRWMRK